MESWTAGVRGPWPLWERESREGKWCGVQTAPEAQNTEPEASSGCKGVWEGSPDGERGDLYSSHHTLNYPCDPNKLCHHPSLFLSGK